MYVTERWHALHVKSVVSSYLIVKSYRVCLSSSAAAGSGSFLEKEKKDNLLAVFTLQLLVNVMQRYKRVGQCASLVQLCKGKHSIIIFDSFNSKGFICDFFKYFFLCLSQKKIESDSLCSSCNLWFCLII